MNIQIPAWDDWITYVQILWGNWLEFGNEERLVFDMCHVTMLIIMLIFWKLDNFYELTKSLIKGSLIYIFISLLDCVRLLRLSAGESEIQTQIINELQWSCWSLIDGKRGES